jgi:N-methylhydantoinase B
MTATPGITEVDPVTLVVVEHSLIEVTREMDVTLERTAFSPVISEAGDRASGIYTVDGEVIAQGPRSLPLFISTMEDTVRAVIDGVPDLEEGDVAIVNDPYLCGTHMMDVRLVKGFFHAGKLLFHIANTGHWSDIGGMSPGSFCGTARDIVQEGLRIPPMKIVRRGEIREDVLGLILNNVRVSLNARGDLHAQLGALVTGEQRLRALVDRYGVETMLAAVAELRDRAVRVLRSRIAEVPDGVYHGHSTLDNDGVDPAPIEIHVAVTVAGDTVRCDFTGSSGPVRGPLNTSLPTTRAGVFIALKHLFPEVPMNAGCFVPVELVVPETSFLNSSYPRAVSGCSGEVSSAVVDAVLRALSEPLPDLVPAGCFRTIAAYTFGGMDPLTGRQYVLYAFNGGGFGGTSWGDGLSNAVVSVGASKAPSLEVMETAYPLLYRRYALREGSAGAGRYRGGLGVDYEVELVRGESDVSAIMSNGIFPPWGSQGGGDGGATELEFELDGERWEPPLRTNVGGVDMRAGDVLRLRTPGGGGWGDPALRDPEAVRRDVRLGYLTREQAQALYAHVDFEAAP